jgi:hypothetical protein
LTIHISPSTMAVVEHIIITAVSLRISGAYHFVLCSSVTRVHHSAGVHRRRSRSPDKLWWPLGLGATTIWFSVVSRFNLANLHVHGSRWASSASPRPRRRWGQPPSQGIDLVVAEVAADLAHGPPVSLIG